jgi:ligand-binding SRPBCC domain-containing protein
MAPYTLEREQFIARPVAEVFAFFSDAANLGRVTPPWLSFRILSPLPVEMRVGARVAYQIGWHFLRLNWVSEIVAWEPSHSFTDVQVRGPYAFWRHTHTFRPHDGGTIMRDTVHYQLPLGPLGRLAHRLKVRQDLEAIFDHRARQFERLLNNPAAPRPRVDRVRLSRLY